MLNREAILKADDLPREELDVPEWGGTVFVRTLTGTERDAFEASMIKGERQVDLTNTRAKLCVRCITDAEGKRLFNDSDIAQLGQKSSRALDRVFEVAQRLNGLSAKDVEDIAKNSGSDPSGSRTSD